MRNRFIGIYLLLVAMGGGMCFAQEGEVAEKPAEQTVTELNSVVESYLAVREQQKEAREAMEAAKPEEGGESPEYERAKQRYEEISDQVDAVKERLKAVASDYEPSFDGAVDELELNLQSELEFLFKPTIDELKASTASTRQLIQLRTEVEALENRNERLKASLTKIEKAIEFANEQPGGADEEILTVFNEARDSLRGLLSVNQANLAATKKRFEDVENSQLPIYEQITQGLKSFFAGRGKSLAIAAFLSAFLFYFLTFVQRKLFKRVGKGGHHGSSFVYRLAELLFTVFRFLVAIAAVFFVFVGFNDWLLVTLTILLVLGILWGTKEALLKGYHKVQLLLNLGPVRQDERVTYNGLPYRVRSLSFYPLLENPALSNSVVRISIDELGDLRMRSDEDDEPWFPTEVGDFVELSDGTYGEVEFQSPERVRVRDMGGQVKTIPTDDFLGMLPINFSEGFARAITFGIDYRHQGLDYNEVGAVFGEKVRLKLLEFLPEDQILATFAAFKEAGSSSLDYVVVAKVSGEAQSKRPAIDRALSQGCLDACNENGWGIPFPQLTVHQAG